MTSFTLNLLIDGFEGIVLVFLEYAVKIKKEEGNMTSQTSTKVRHGVNCS